MKRLMAALFALMTVLLLGIPALAAEAEAEPAPTLRVRDAAQTAVLSAEFDPEISDYYMYTQADTYGIEFTPQGMAATINGDEVADGEAYIYDLPQEQESMYDTYFGTVEVVADGKTYTYTIIREDPGYITTDAFELKTFAVEGGEMYYWLYVPEDYDASRAYPVVLYLHGGGQRTQPADMVLLRNQAAGSFVKYGYEAIVIAPQSNYTDLSANIGWGDQEMGLTVFGQGAYDILQLIKSEYNVDENREYVTGLSMGGVGSYTMIANHPEEFAAAIINCGIAYDFDKFAGALKQGGTQIMLVHSTGDESVDFVHFQNITAALNKADISYKTVVYGPDDFLYPMRHFSWQPAYADVGNLDWLFSQSRADRAIVDIKVEDPAMMPTPAFNPEITNYEMNVVADTYGIQFTVYGEGPLTINGDTVKSGEKWIIEFSQEQAEMRTQFTEEVVIAGGGQTYTYTITREELSEVYDSFELKTWPLADGSGEMYYWLRLPEGYDAGKEYPVVLFLHGGGQRTQDPEMVLMRNRAATAFAFADEDAIIIAPQCNYTDLSSDLSWVSGDDLAPTIFGDATADIVRAVLDEYACDEARVSVTGLSMGCTGSLGVASAHPDLFSAVLCATPTIEDANAIKALADNNIPVRFTLCITDPNPNKLKTYTRLHEAIAAHGVAWEETLYWSHAFIFPNQHFSWAAMYADQENINWLIAQEKAA